MTRKVLFGILISIALAGLSFNYIYAAVPLNNDLRPDNVPTISGDVTDTTSSAEAARRILTTRAVNIILGVAGVIAIFFILLNGFWLITSAGREETLTQHKKGLTWAIIGLLLVILSYSIIRFVITTSFQANEQTLNSAQGPGAPTPVPPAQ